jgi:hypothetical protein
VSPTAAAWVGPRRQNPRRSAAWFTVIAVVAAAGYLVHTMLLALAAQPGPPWPGALGGYEQPDNPWPIAVQVLLGATAFAAYWWPRREENRSFSLLVTASLAVSTLVLGVASFWGCPSGQAPFWTPLARALNLVVGGVNDTCGFPLALQTARLLGPLLLVITALGVLATLFRSQRDRLAVRAGRRVVLVVGLAPETTGMISRLAEDRAPGTVVAVVAGTAESGLLRSARRAGARIIALDVADTRALQVLLVRRRLLKVTEAQLLSGDTAVNLGWAAALRELAAGCDHRASSLAPRLLVRIDDPWQAEYWRRGNTYQGHPGRSGVTWMCDAVSQPEITARLLVHRLQQGLHDRLALVGGSPLALAVCAELAQCDREERLLDRPDRPLAERLTLVGAAAPRLARLHQLWQGRFGDLGPALTVADGPDVTDTLEQVLAGAVRPAVLIADDGQAAASGSELAFTHPEWTVFARSDTTRGVAAAPILEGLLPFGLTPELPSDWPLDSWERAARVVHERYRLHADPDAAANRPWSALDRFLRESNIRLITTTLSSVESIGRSWLPATATDRSASSTEVSQAQLMRLAELEHESWQRHLSENGWRWGATRDHARKTHPALRPWSELAVADREQNVTDVAGAVATLAALGYRSTPVVHGLATWRRFSRAGDVVATLSTVPWTWRSPSGAVLRADVGDWRVSDGDQVWSVAGEIFTRTYAHLGGDRWRRTGEVSGRPATPGEIVRSLEGDQIAAAGEWVLRGDAGEEWLVTSSHLAAHYRPLPAEEHGPLVAEHRLG